MLALLKMVKSGNQIDVQNDMLRLAVKKCSPRISSYKTAMQTYARKCRMKLREEPSNETVTKLRIKLERLSEPSPVTFMDLIDLCYTMRGPEVEEIRRISRLPDDDFRSLAHYIGRLGGTRSSVNSIVQAMIIIPSLHEISAVRVIEAPEVRVVTIESEHMSPYEIVRGICKETKSQNPGQLQSALRAVVDIDLPLNNADDVRLHLASRKTTIARVHAELQLADRFSRSTSMEFLGSDKYIGCSKPACYFCYNWLSNHKHKYVIPSTHKKVIPGCRGPDHNLNAAGAKVLNEMYAKICGTLDQHILDHLLIRDEQDSNRSRQYMSTEGSSHATSRMPTARFGADAR